MENKPYFVKLLPVPEKTEATELFVCNVELRLGDTAYHDNYQPYPNGEVLDTNSKVMDYGMMHPEAYKVIGKISPEATWVTEGMRFSEDELQPWHWVEDTGSFKLSEKYEEGNHNYKGWLTFIKIQCSQCKHFH